MQQLQPLPGPQPLRDVRVGVMAERNAAIVAIEGALRAAGAGVQRVAPASAHWRMDGLYDVVLVLVPPPDGRADARYEASLALLAGLAARHRVIALLREPLRRPVPGLRDFVLEPFRAAEVVARVAHALEGARLDADLRAGDLRLDPTTRQVTVGGQPVEVTYYEFEILHVLLEAAGAVLSRDDMMRRLAHDAPPTSRWLDIHIHRLRAKLAAMRGASIETVRGVGYRLATR